MPKLQQFIERFILGILALLFVTCSNDKDDVMMLEKADNLMSIHPAEAMEYLDSISEPQYLDKEYYMEYIVLHSLGKYMTGDTIPEGDDLSEARWYFRKQNNLRFIALADYCLGNRHLEKDEYVPALKWFYEAVRYAEESKDHKLTGKTLNKISYAYYEQGVYSEAARQSKQALLFFDKVDGSEVDMMMSIGMIGLWYYKKLELDSAILRYQEGLEIARSINNKEEEARFKSYLGMVEGRAENYKSAVAYLNEALQGVATTDDSLLVYNSFLLTYNRQKNTEMAAPYAKIMEERCGEIKIKSRQRDALRELSRYNEQIGNADKSLEYRKEESRLFARLERMRSAENFLTIKEDYDLSLKDMDMRNQQLWYSAIILFIILMGLLVAAFLYIRIREARFKNEEKETQNQMLEERMKNFEYLRLMYKSTIVRLVRMDKRVQELIEECRKTSSEILPVYVEMQDLIKSLRRNSQYHYLKFADDYIKKQPHGEEFIKMLDVPNKIIFILCHLRYNQSEMASMVGMTRKSVMMRRYDIRNALIKVGISEKEANALIFFEQGESDDNTKN